jgi:hypothetical protein
MKANEPRHYAEQGANLRSQRRRRTGGEGERVKRDDAQLGNATTRDKTPCLRASTCFAAKLIESFPGKLAFDDLTFDNFPIISGRESTKLSAL